MWERRQYTVIIEGEFSAKIPDKEVECTIQYALAVLGKPYNPHKVTVIRGEDHGRQQEQRTGKNEGGS